MHKIQTMDKQLEGRDHEIQRLHLTYQGGQTFDKVKDGYQKELDNQTLSDKNTNLTHQLESIAQIIGYMHGPDVSSAGIPQQVEKFRSQLRDLQEDNSEMERVIQNLRNSQETMGFTGKLQNDQEQQHLRRNLQDAEDRLHALERENRQMK